MKRIATAALIAVLCVATLLLSETSSRPEIDPSMVELGTAPADLASYVIENFTRDTGAGNAVAAIYLNYRVYDTLFEALLLLIAIVGIMHFFRIGSRRDNDG